MNPILLFFIVIVALFWIVLIGGTYISNRLPNNHKFRLWWEKYLISEDPYHK